MASIHVSILVLMEVVLKFTGDGIVKPRGFSFNPCFDGSGSEIKQRERYRYCKFCFNPCFDGSGSEIRKKFSTD